MFSLRSHLPPAPSTRRLPRAAKHGLSCDLVSALPPVTSHESPFTNSFRIRTYEKSVRNPFRMRTYKTQDLKPFRMNTYKKNGGWVPAHNRRTEKERGHDESCRYSAGILTICPGRMASRSARQTGASGNRSFRRFDFARKMTMAI